MRIRTIPRAAWPATWWSSAIFLANRLAKIWTADDGPAPGVGDSDAVYHHVRESTETILRQAGASAKDRRGRGRAWTAKHVRPGPIAGADGEQPRPGPTRWTGDRPSARPNPPPASGRDQTPV